MAPGADDPARFDRHTQRARERSAPANARTSSRIGRASEITLRSPPRNPAFPYPPSGDRQRRREPPPAADRQDRADQAQSGANRVQKLDLALKPRAGSGEDHRWLGQDMDQPRFGQDTGGLRFDPNQRCRAVVLDRGDEGGPRLQGQAMRRQWLRRLGRFAPKRYS